ncbi:MAG: hypothetical protein FD127_2576 [Acidimicrobiaceae bacterium]|nr:MAG: hypothetical protein FD127_2576 [Acidimicrobiaceae bacterium]
MVAVYNSTVTATTAQARSGTGSLQVVSTGGGWWSLQDSGTRPTVTPGVAYTFTIWAKAATVVAPLQLKVTFYNAGGTTFGDLNVSPPVNDTTSGWTQLQATVIAPPTAATVNFGSMTTA